MRASKETSSVSSLNSMTAGRLASCLRGAGGWGQAQGEGHRSTVTPGPGGKGWEVRLAEKGKERKEEEIWFSAFG